MQRVTLAHTVVDVPEHFYRVPAYYRRHTMDPKVRIGCTFRPAIIVAPAVEIHVPSEPGVFRKALWAVGLVSFFVTLYLIGLMLQRSGF